MPVSTMATPVNRREVMPEAEVGGMASVLRGDDSV